MILTKNKVDSIDIDFEINKKIKSAKLDEFLLIVPTNRRIRYLKREIISQTPKKAAERINLETIGTFSTNLLFSEAAAKNKILSEAASVVLLEQSFREANLKYFSAYRNEIPAGTLDKIKNVISEYKKHGIFYQDLMRESGQLEGSEKIKAEDISNIYKIYQEKIRLLNVKEIGDIYSELNKINNSDFEKRFRELYPAVNLIIINGFDEFTSPEIEIINSISNIKKSKLYITFDYYNYNHAVFSHLDKCYIKLTGKGFTPVKDASISLFQKFQTDIRERLFKKAPAKKIETFKNNITKITAQSREKEIELIAKEIRELIIEKGIEPNKICAVFNLIHNYSPVIRDIFSVYNIPFNLTDRFPLSASPPVTSIINFLEILENDFYYKNIFRALSGGYLQIKNVDLSNLLNASVSLRIISGISNWKDSLNDAINIENEDEDDFPVFKLEIYKKALEDIKVIEKNLEPFKKNMTLDEFYENLLNLIFSLNLPISIINNTGESKEKNVKALSVFIETVKEIIYLFKDEYGSDKKFPLRFFLNNIRTAAASSRYNIKEKPGFGVQVTTLNEIRGLKFDYLFISGLCDGDLPTRYMPEIFFSGSYLKNEATHQTEERYHFYQALCSWEKSLYLTYPMHNERQEFSESNFLSGFEKIFSVKYKNENNYSGTIYSKEELLKFMGEQEAENINENIFEIEKLLDLNRLEHSIKVDRLRIKAPFDESEFTGYISKNLSEKGKEILGEFKNKEYSISQLETYAKCPYKYFAERILKLKPAEDPTEEFEAREMGSMLHKILFEFYEKIKRKGIILTGASGDNFKFAENLIFEIAESKINEANYNSPLTFYEKEKILGINGRRRNSILFKFLETEQKQDGFIPEYFEIGFGNLPYRGVQEKNIVIKDLKAGEVSIRGKIDRIDLSEDGKFKIVDYKLSGKHIPSSDLLDGISLQLPLYMFAAKELIKVQLNKDFEPAGGEIYSLKFSNNDFGKREISIKAIETKFALDRDSCYKKLIEICIEAIEKYVKQIYEGKFNLSTLKDREKKVCGYCSFKPICRIREVN